MVVLRAALGYYLDARSNAIAIALGSLKLEFQPMVVAWALIDPDLRPGTKFNVGARMDSTSIGPAWNRYI
jgi:hypothetical protein